uniref:Cytochrome c biogenesis protein CcsA n=1 Tax=Cuscuta africana TaxID=413235 RepID=A0A7H0DGN1_9ASTE|nr:cytochrome c biogenesis protein [Cuscuta africana]QNP08491.1 cytochrome c biogenesis protein [Cuscuta africana]
MIVSTLEHILMHISFSIVLVSIFIEISLRIFLVAEIAKLYHSSEKGMLVSFLGITGFLITHLIYFGHFPLSDLTESLIFLSWSLALIKSIPYFKKNTQFLNTLTSPSVSFTQAFATSGLLTEKKTDSILVPVLQSEWLIMHVSMMILGYAALLCGSLLSIALMVMTFQKNSFCSYSSYNNYYKILLSQELDYWSYRIINFGFILLTIGILSGAVWANEAWGSYWSWDPKETWAFITWLVFTIYLHIRKKINWEGPNSAIVASIGFFIIWICYFGVNLVGLGLHSYGSFPLTYN